MEQGTFIKCENCHIKPATVKLFRKGSPIEKKLCYHCEKQLITMDQYKQWISQHLPYSSLKQASFDVSKSFSVSTLDSVLKSPILSSNVGISYLQKNRIGLASTIEMSQGLIDVSSRSKISEGLKSSKVSTVRYMPDVESALREINFSNDNNLKYKLKTEIFSMSGFNPKTNFENEEKIDNRNSRDLAESKSSMTASQRNPLRITLSESKHKVQKQLITEVKLKERLNRENIEDKNYAMYIQEQKNLNFQKIHKQNQSNFSDENEINTSTNYTDEMTEWKYKDTITQIETNSKKHEENRQEYSEEYEEAVKHYKSIIETYELDIQHAEKDGAKIINELKSEIWKVHEEIEKCRQVEDIRRTNERSKINSKMDGISKELEREVENKRFLQDKFDATNAQYEQQIYHMKIHFEKIQADTLNEISELERNIVHQKDYHAITKRDTKESQESYIIKMKRDHQSKVCNLELEFDKMTDNLIKSEREKDEAVSEIELKLQHLQEKVNHDQENVKMLRQALEEKNERIERIKQKTCNVEQEAIVFRHEIELIQKEKERLRVENKKLLAKYSKLNKIYHGK